MPKSITTGFGSKAMAARTRNRAGAGRPVALRSLGALSVASPSSRAAEHPTQLHHPAGRIRPVPR
ncbi:hypothetical protein [Kitasatospora griseola]|uniref:hypothetical protein n=1 Tax=Kitasatospora griseola TaxID=2064 RepID=UPI003817E542